MCVCCSGCLHGGRSLKAVEWTGEGRGDRWQWWGAVKQEGGGRRGTGQEVSFHCLPRRMDMGTGMCTLGWLGGEREGRGISFVPRPTTKKDLGYKSSESGDISLSLVTQVWVWWHKSESGDTSPSLVTQVWMPAWFCGNVEAWWSGLLIGLFWEWIW